MSLIQELQDDILDPKTSLSTILRRAKVLASDLKNEEFKKWVDNELNGYSGNSKELPDYRKIMAYNNGQFVGSFGRQGNNVPIPTLNLPEPIKKFANELILDDGVRALESLIEGKSDSFSIYWPPDMVAIIR